MGAPGTRRPLRAWFVRRREVWQLTWPARLLLIVGILSTCTLLSRGAGTFLAVDAPVGGEYLVVEGWMPAYTYERAGELWRSGGYRKVIAVGVVPDDAMSNGAPREYAAVGSLIAAGIPQGSIVQAMGAGVHQDRTYHSALNVQRWLSEQNLQHTSIDVLTLGPHARRSRLLFVEALGPSVTVGVIAVPERRYDISHWWRTSEGVRSVVGESIAYLYARFFFEESDLGCEDRRC
jgi:DUF218 domain